MVKLLKVLGIAWGICKRFDLEELKEIVEEVKGVVKKFEELKDDGINVEEGIEIVKEAVNVYNTIKEAYED